MAGFHDEAFQELKTHQGDPIFENATIVVDAMSIKEYLQYDPKIKRTFGYVDHGANATATGSNVIATDALVVMLVSMKGRWKLPLAYLYFANQINGYLINTSKKALRLSLFIYQSI